MTAQDPSNPDIIYGESQGGNIGRYKVSTGERERIEEAGQRVLAEHGAAALQYSTTEGYLPLRELLVRSMAATASR